MPDFPLHPTLFFSLSIILGLVLSYFFTLADLIDKKDKKFIMVNLFLYGSWTVAALFAIFIVYLIETDTQRAVAFAPLGMMIAALIASASVMKNIAETKANEAEKHKKEASKFHLDKCTEGLEHVYGLLSDNNNKYDRWEAAANSLITILELSENITEQQHKHFFAIEKSKYCLKLNKLYTDLNEFFFAGSTIWRDDGSSNSFTRNERFKERLDKAGQTGYAKNIDPSSIRVIFSVCIDSLHQKVSDVPLHKWKKNNSEITENEFSWWEAHDVLKHAVPLIKYFKEKNKEQ